MSEERKRNYRSLVLKSLALFLALFSVMTTTGCGYRVIGKIDNYHDFLKNYTKYNSGGQSQGDELTPEDLPVIAGFEPVCNYTFEFGNSFNGEYVFVRCGDKCYLLKRDGNLTETTDDLKYAEIVGDKYVFVRDGKKGVYTISVGETIEAVYDEIQIMGNTVLAIAGNQAETYIGDKKIASAGFTNFALLVDENYVLCDNVYCDTSLAPLYACGYPYNSVPSEGIVRVALGDGLFGYADIVGNKLIGGRYTEANLFSEGVAIAVDSEGSTVIIDKNGAIIGTMRDITLFDRHNNYFCCNKNGIYGLLDTNLVPIALPPFNRIYRERVYSDCLIVEENKEFYLYSLKSNSYVMKNCVSIYSADNAFICVKQDEALIINGDGNIVLTCEEAQYSSEILRVKLEGRYSYYRRVTAKNEA